jgi:hypothetical protein
MPSKGELVPGSSRGNPIGFALVPSSHPLPGFAEHEARERAIAARDNLNELIRARVTKLEPALSHLATSVYEDQRAEEVTALGPVPRFLPGRTYLREKQHDLTTRRRRKKTGEQSTSSREIVGEGGIIHPVVIKHHLDNKGNVVVDSYTQRWPLRKGAYSDLTYTMNEGKLGMIELRFGYEREYGAYRTGRGTLYDQVFAPYWGSREQTQKSPKRDETEARAAKAAASFPDNIYYDGQDFWRSHTHIALILDDQPSSASDAMSNHYQWMNSQAPEHRGPQVFIDNVRSGDYMSSTGHYGFDAAQGDEGEFTVLRSKSGRESYPQDRFGKSLSVAEFMNVLDHMLDLAAVIKTDPQAITA